MIKVFQKADALLRSVAENGPTRFTDLRRRHDINKATLSQILNSMVELRWLRRDEDGKFAVGEGLKAYAAESVTSERTKTLLTTTAKTIADDIEELTTAAVFENDQRKVVAKYEGGHLVRVDENAGSGPESIFKTATGMTLLARMDPERAESFVKRHGLVDEYQRSLDALSEIRRTGVCHMDFRGEVRTVAIPVRSPSGKTIAVIGFAAPAYRMDDDKKRVAVAALRKRVERLEEDLH